MIEDSFFRSMSLAEDLSDPTRFAHYRPTRRASSVLEAVLTPNSATMVIAPYGSGKSLSAGVAAIAVRNEHSDREVLKGLLPEVAAIAANAGAMISDRVKTQAKGLVVALSGYQQNPLETIAVALGMKKVPQTVDGLSKALRNSGADHVAIIWDEFGRHLEGLVGDGRPDELDFLQRLAERSVRATAPTMSLTLLLHQNLLAYAARLNETTRSEWRKIEGRFSTVRMVEDSQEIYELASQVVAGLRHQQASEEISSTLVDAVRDARWFDGMEDADRISQVLSDSQPLTPGALQVLPTLVARVGQNERSLFAFLRETDLSQTVGIEEVYSAFSDALRSDVGIGGAYKRWLETESARSRAKTEVQRELLAAACLLQLGVSGERRRLPRSVLELSVLRPEVTPKEVSKAVDDLLKANLLLWRKHNDDVSVWHGADIDVSMRVKEEREKKAIGFDLKEFLNERFAAPNLRTPGHNSRFGVNRFFAGNYIYPDDIGSLAEASFPEISYVLAVNKAEVDEAHDAARESDAGGRIIVVPKRPIDVQSAAIEVLALEALKADKDFLSSDPMVATELGELESVAFGQLALLLRTLLDPRGSTATWWSERRTLDVSGDRPGSMAASALLDQWYNLTPSIINEQLMRDQASRTMQTARVRMIGAVLAHHATPRLGYSADDSGSEGSIYRTVLERTGLHKPDANCWRFADPHELADEGLKAAWAEIGVFFRKPTSPQGKPLKALIDLLNSRPHGVPRAVLPLLIAAGYVRFAHAVAIYQDGIYLPDLLGFQFDQLVSIPEDVVVRVEEVDIRKMNYLRELCYAFTHETPGEDELIRRAYDAVMRWRATVPEGSKRTQKLEASGKALLRAIDEARDPVDLLLRDIPQAFGIEVLDARAIAQIERARTLIDRLADEFAKEAMATVEEAFRVSGGAGSLLDAVRAWANCFDTTAMESRGDLRISDKAVLRKASETANGRFSPKSFAASLSSILLQRPLDKWDDRTAVQFRTALRETRERIETAALDTDQPTPSLKPIVEARLKDLQSLLDKLNEPTVTISLEKKKSGGAR